MGESIEATRESKDKLPRLARDNPSGTSSPPAAHSTPDGKYVTNKHLEVENPQK